MRRSICRRLLLSLSLLLPLAVLAQDQDAQQPLQSDWLELVKGYREEAMGVELREVEDGEVDGTRKITLAIPKSAMSDPDTIEEVVVVGRRPEKSEPMFDTTFEWLDDYDNDNYGLVIRLSKDSKWPIRLYLYSDTGFIQ